jgi:hypothetical protein
VHKANLRDRPLGVPQLQIKDVEDLAGAFGVGGRIIAFIQDAHSIKEILKTRGIPEFQAPPPIPKFIYTSHAVDELPFYDSFEPSPDDF